MRDEAVIANAWNSWRKLQSMCFRCANVNMDTNGLSRDIPCQQFLIGGMASYPSVLITMWYWERVACIWRWVYQGQVMLDVSKERKFCKTYTRFLALFHHSTFVRIVRLGLNAILGNVLKRFSHWYLPTTIFLIAVKQHLGWKVDKLP